MTNEGPVHRPQPCRVSWNVMFCHGRSPVRPARSACGSGCGALRQRRRRFWRGSVAVMRTSFGAKGGTGVPVLRAFRVCGRAGRGAGGRIAAARLVRLIARARRRTHLACPFPPGSFSRPPAGCFLQKRGKAAPGAASLYFHSTPYRQMSSLLARIISKNENEISFPGNAGARRCVSRTARLWTRDLIGYHRRTRGTDRE